MGCVQVSDPSLIFRLFLLDTSQGALHSHLLLALTHYTSPPPSNASNIRFTSSNIFLFFFFPPTFSSSSGIDRDSERHASCGAFTAGSNASLTVRERADRRSECRSPEINASLCAFSVCSFALPAPPIQLPSSFPLIIPTLAQAYQRFQTTLYTSVNIRCCAGCRVEYSAVQCSAQGKNCSCRKYA